MAVTALQVVQRVCRKVGLDATITAFSEDDESNDLLQDVNEAYEELIMTLPSECPFLNSSATITTVASTRLYSLTADAAPFDLYTWSFEDETDSDATLRTVTKEFIMGLDPQWDELIGTPQYIYLEGNGQVGVYPIPNGVFTINYQYGAASITRVAATTDTFVVPDRWVRWIEKRAQELYERRKGFQEPDETAMEALQLLNTILVEAWEMTPSYMLEDPL